jgi:hypothetical protein
MGPPRGRSCQWSSTGPKGPEQQGGEFARAAAKARADDAGFPVGGKPATVHERLFSRQKPVRSAPFPPLCPCHPPPPPSGNGGLESRGGRARLKSTRQGLLRAPQVNVTSPPLARGPSGHPDRHAGSNCRHLRGIGQGSYSRPPECHTALDRLRNSDREHRLC